MESLIENYSETSETVYFHNCDFSLLCVAKYSTKLIFAEATCSSANVAHYKLLGH